MRGRLRGRSLGPSSGSLWALQRRLLWPLQDRVGELSGPAACSPPAAVRRSWSPSSRWRLCRRQLGRLRAAPEPRRRSPSPRRPPPSAAPAPAPKPSGEPTLHGAAPVFKPAQAKRLRRGRAAAKPIESLADRHEATAPATTTSSAATGKISSDPSSTASSRRRRRDLDGRGPAGRPAKAIAVAREFSGAFVVYETGGERGDGAPGVRRRPRPRSWPRRCCGGRRGSRPNVKVPKAKVVNVVAGPSHGRRLHRSASRCCGSA